MIAQPIWHPPCDSIAIKGLGRKQWLTQAPNLNPIGLERPIPIYQLRRRSLRCSRWFAWSWRAGASGILLGAALAFVTPGGVEVAATDRPSGSSATPAGESLVPRPVDTVLIVGGGRLIPSGFGTVNSGPMPPLDEVPQETARIGDLASRILTAEGGPGRNPASSAAGYGQFLRGTWLDIFGRAYPDLARKLSAEQILALREVKPLATDLTRQYADENAENLRRQGIRTTDATLSLAHAVGPAGAASILTATPTQSVRELLSREAIAANPQFATMTANAMRQWAADRITAEATPRPAASVVMRRADPPLTLSPSEDFRFDGSRMASEVLRSNQTHIAQLQRLIETPSSVS